MGRAYLTFWKKRSSLIHFRESSLIHSQCQASHTFPNCYTLFFCLYRLPPVLLRVSDWHLQEDHAVEGHADVPPWGAHLRGGQADRAQVLLRRRLARQIAKRGHQGPPFLQGSRLGTHQREAGSHTSPCQGKLTQRLSKIHYIVLGLKFRFDDREFEILPKARC